MKSALRFFFFLCLAFTCLLQQVSAQGFCGSEQRHRHLMQTDARYKQEYLDFKQQLRSLVQQQSAMRRGGPAQIYTIPVVVHVAHLGEPVGTGSNISDAQIQNALNGLNDRYKNIIGNSLDMEIEFCLAVRDEHGNSTNGINRFNASAVAGYAADGIAMDGSAGAVDDDIKALSIWPHEDYYNIWVVTEIQGGTAGYANYPTGLASEGTVIEATYMTYNSDVLTHEMGHALSLAHTFEGDGDDAFCPPNTTCLTQGDEICDTPPHKQNDCGSSNPCTASGTWDNSRYNYMSYCNNSDRFTADQKIKVTTTLTTHPFRASLLNSVGCMPVVANDAAIAKIVSPNPTACDSIFFPTVLLKNFGTAALTSVTINYSIDNGPLHTYAWTGSIPRDSARAVQLNSVSIPGYGTYQITAYTTLPNGSADGYSANDDATSTFEYYQMVNVLPVKKDFNTGPYPPARWKAESFYAGAPDPFSWRDTTLTCKNGVYALMNWEYPNHMVEPFQHDLYSEIIDMSNYTSPAIAFDVAYKRSYSNLPVSLFVDVSRDCGRSFTNVYSKTETSLASVTGFETATGWFPTSCNQWRRDSVSLSAFATDKIIVRFRCVVDTDFGQNLFLDNINISGTYQGNIATANFTATPSSGCAPLSVTFNNLSSAGATTFNWSFPGGTPAQYTGQTPPAVTYSAPGTYTIRLVASNGFSTDTTLRQVTVTNNLNVAVTSSTPNASCSSPNGSATVAASGGVTPYTYTWNDGSTGATKSALAAGSYTVTATDVNGCSGTLVVNITTQTAVITVTAVQVNAATCLGSNGSASASATGGTGPYTYAWNNSGTGNLITGLAPATYTVTATDTSGCTGTQNVTITSTTLTLNVTINKTDQTSCLTPNGTATATVASGQAPFSYAWNNGPATQTDSSLSQGTYTVTVSDANSCSGTASVTISSPSSPTANITGNLMACPGGTTTLDAGAGFTNYAWSNAQTARTVSVAAGTYTVTITNALGCTATDSKTVNLHTVAQPVITGSSTVCTGTTTTLDAGSGFTAYAWSNSATTRNTALGDGTHTVTVTDGNTCTSTGTFTITSSTHLTLAISPNSPAFCPGGSVTLTSGGADTLRWSTTVIGNSITVSSAGTYSITGTNSGGCSGTASATVTQHAVNAPVITGDTIICAGTTTSLDAGNGFVSYDWSSGDTSQVTTAIAGDYSVTVTDNNNCSTSDTVTITSISNPTVNIAATRAGFCPGGSTTLIATGANTYVWSSTQTTDSITVQSAATFSVVGTDTNGCEGSDTIAVTQYPAPNATATATPDTVQIGSTTTFAATGGTDYQWSTGDTVVSFVDTVSVNTTHTVTVTDANGCTATASATVVIRIDTGACNVTLNPSSLEFFAAGYPGEFDVTIGNPGSNCGWSVVNADEIPWVMEVTPTGQQVGGGQVSFIVLNNFRGTAARRDTLIISAGGIEYYFPIYQHCGLPTPVIRYNIDGRLIASNHPDAGGTYQWYESGVLIADSNAQAFTTPGNGIYQVQVVSANGECVSELSSELTLTGVEEFTEYDFAVYPNPNTGSFTIQFETQGEHEVTLDILNLLGQKVQRLPQETISGKYLKNITLENISAGIYFARITIDGTVVNKKIVVQD